jgi:ABC-type branched-subunit amino acid transport system ATPase component
MTTITTNGLAIEARDLVKHFGPVQAVNGISLEVPSSCLPLARSASGLRS